MAQNQIQNVTQALERAKEEDVFLVALNKEELERTGFDTSVFGSFQFVNIYLQWDDEYQIKYEFDSDPSQTYYFYEHEARDDETFMKIVKEYIALGGGE